MEDYLIALRSRDNTPATLLRMDKEHEGQMIDGFRNDMRQKIQGELKPQCDEIRWLFFNIWPFTTTKLCPIPIFPKIGSKYYQILNKAFEKLSKTSIIFSQIDEILPNLVTLFEAAVWPTYNIIKFCQRRFKTLSKQVGSEAPFGRESFWFGMLLMVRGVSR